MKQSCLEAHGQGQDEMAQGHITIARSHFSNCAQLTCPALVKDDCARLLDEAERSLPSVSFSARDARGVDLPDTRVFVDGELLLSRLDGIWHSVDPGMHVVRFEHGDQRQEQEIIVAAGEKGRLIVGAFAASRLTAPIKAERRGGRVGPGLALGASAALAVTGGALAIVGLTGVPDSCSLTKHECAAPPGDPAFRQASRAVRLSNAGWAVGGVGLAALAGSLIWYFKSANAREHARARHTVAPFASARAVGVAVDGTF
ncbi:MAG TPA: hypothetical protein VMF89_32050 [Polyangiales bacterium]|nr:hypothetical protein [Polyangiales bacterium]